MRTQPLGQTCSLAASTGAGVAGTSVNVQITCSVNSFRIAGTTSGLSGTNTVGLSLNGGTALIASNGPFDFGPQIAFDGSYAVTVATQPTGQTCSVSNASGAGVVAHISNVAVVCSANTCPAQTLSWQGATTCSAAVPATNSGQSVSLVSTLANTTGSATYRCTNGSFSPPQSPLCTAVPPPPPPPPAAPSITSQPASTSVVDGQTTSFTVQASDISPLGYAWLRNGAAIAGATSSTLRITGLLADSGARYAVLVCNPTVCTTSSDAILTVTPAPIVLTNQPQAVTVLEGAATSFSVAGTGTAPITYRWLSNGTSIPGATSSSFSFTTALADNGKRFSAVLTNGAGSVTSTTALLTVNPAPPVFATQPANVATNDGTAASFTAAATSSTPVSYQWRRNGEPIAGATGTSVSVNPVFTALHGTRFDVVATNAGGSTTSTVALLSVSPVAGSVRGWGTAQLIRDPSLQVQLGATADVGMDDAGRVHVSWVNDGASGLLNGLRFNPAAGGGWEAVRAATLFGGTIEKQVRVWVNASGQQAHLTTLNIANLSIGIRQVGLVSGVAGGSFLNPGALGSTGAPLNQPGLPFYSSGLDGAGNLVLALRNSFGVLASVGVAALVNIDTPAAGQPAAVAGDLPSLAVNPAGQAVAVWRQAGTANPNTFLWANRYTPGVGWSGAIRFGPVAQAWGIPGVAIDANGNAVLVVTQVTNPTGATSDATTLQTARWEVGDATWGLFRTLDSTASCVVGFGENSSNPRFGFPAVQLMATGRALAVRTCNDPFGGTQVRAVDFGSAATNPNVGATLITGPSGTRLPSIALNANGDAALAYLPSATGVGDVFVHQSSGVTANWQPRVVVGFGAGATLPALLTGDVRLAINASGQLALIWTYGTGQIGVNLYR